MTVYSPALPWSLGPWGILQGASESFLMSPQGSLKAVCDVSLVLDKCFDRGCDGELDVSKLNWGGNDSKDMRALPQHRSDFTWCSLSGSLVSKKMPTSLYVVVARYWAKAPRNPS